MPRPVSLTLTCGCVPCAVKPKVTSPSCAVSRSALSTMFCKTRSIKAMSAETRAWRWCLIQAEARYVRGGRHRFAGPDRIESENQQMGHQTVCMESVAQYTPIEMDEILLKVLSQFLCFFRPDRADQ
jgi:hypothetical protein